MLTIDEGEACMHKDGKNLRVMNYLTTALSTNKKVVCNKLCAQLHPGVMIGHIIL